MPCYLCCLRSQLHLRLPRGMLCRRGRHEKVVSYPPPDGLGSPTSPARGCTNDVEGPLPHPTSGSLHLSVVHMCVCLGCPIQAVCELLVSDMLLIAQFCAYLSSALCVHFCVYIMCVAVLVLPAAMPRRAAFPVLASRPLSCRSVATACRRVAPCGCCQPAHHPLPRARLVLASIPTGCAKESLRRRAQRRTTSEAVGLKVIEVEGVWWLRLVPESSSLAADHRLDDGASHVVVSSFQRTHIGCVLWWLLTATRPRSRSASRSNRSG